MTCCCSDLDEATQSLFQWGALYGAPLRRSSRSCFRCVAELRPRLRDEREGRHPRHDDSQGQTVACVDSPSVMRGKSLSSGRAFEFTMRKVGATLLTTLIATQGVWITGSCPTPRAKTGPASAACSCSCPEPEFLPAACVPGKLMHSPETPWKEPTKQKTSCPIPRSSGCTVGRSQRAGAPRRPIHWCPSGCAAMQGTWRRYRPDRGTDGGCAMGVADDPRGSPCGTLSRSVAVGVDPLISRRFPRGRGGGVIFARPEMFVTWPVTREVSNHCFRQRAGHVVPLRLA